jgi:hypothetical protein
VKSPYNIALENSGFEHRQENLEQTFYTEIIGLE